jgi:phosphomannomutase
MAELQGKVLSVKVGDDFAVAKIREDGTGDEESIFIWWYQEGQPKPPTYRRTIQGMQISLLTEALVNGLSVVILWDENTGLPLNIRLLAAP